MKLKEADPLIAFRLKPEQYVPLMSEYLLNSKKSETWHINWVEWDGKVLTASARLDGWTASATDGNSFHLSVYSARELEAQLGIIGLHLRLGLYKKCAEVWLLKCTEECFAAITNPEDVRFEMEFLLRRSQSGKIISERKSRIFDSAGGRIGLSILSLMPWHDDWGHPPVG